MYSWYSDVWVLGRHSLVSFDGQFPHWFLDKLQHRGYNKTITTCRNNNHWKKATKTLQTRRETSRLAALFACPIRAITMLVSLGSITSIACFTASTKKSFAECVRHSTVWWILLRRRFIWSETKASKTQTYVIQTNSNP